MLAETLDEKSQAVLRNPRLSWLSWVWGLSWVCWVSWSVLGFALTGAAQPAPRLRGVTRIYVEPFLAKPGSDRLRDALIARLRKLRAISLVTEATAADAIVIG